MPRRRLALSFACLGALLLLGLAGCRGAVSDSVPPDAPSDVTATAASGRIDVAWTVPSDAAAGGLDGFDVERSDDAGDTWTAAVSVGGSARSATVASLTDYTAYRVRVAARRDGLRSAWGAADASVVPRPAAGVGRPDAPDVPPSPGDAFVVVGDREAAAGVSAGDASLALDAGPRGAVVLYAPLARDGDRDVAVLAPNDVVEVEVRDAFAPGTQAVVELRSEVRTLATFPVDASGRTRHEIPVPTDLAAGAHTLRVRGANASASDVRFVFGVRVAEAARAVVDVTVSPTSVSVVEGTTTPLRADVTALGGAPTTVSWTSADPAVAAVDDGGVVTAVAPGATRITARSTFAPSVTDVVTVTVTDAPAVTRFALEASLLVLEPGTSRTPTAVVETLGGADAGVTWRTLDASVATVDADGRVTAQAPGRTTLEVTSAFDPTRTASLTVSVTLPRTVAAAYYQSFALDDQGRGWSWGAFADGALGHGAMPDPVVTAARRMDMGAVEGGRFVSMEGGLNVAFGLTPSGRLYAWGSNGSGVLGVGNTFGQREKSTAPLAVDAPADVRFVQVDVGEDHAVALDDQGRAWAWGAGDEYQLGNGENSLRTRPTRVDMRALPAGVTFARVAAGVNHSVAVDTEGAVWTWGDNGVAGALGDDSAQTYRERPTRIDPASFAGDPTFVDVAAGYEVTCVLSKEEGEVWCWGEGSRGQLGRGETTDSDVPVQVDLSALGAAGRTARHLVAGRSHAFVVDDQGGVWAWGNDASEQLGTAATATDATTPVAVVVPSGVDVVALAADDHHSVLLDADHRAWTWGSGANGELGIAVTTTDAATAQPVRTILEPTFTRVDAGVATAAALDDADRTWIWGDAIYGMASPTDRPVLVDTASLPDGVVFTDLAVGSGHVLALDGAGALWAWGGNGSGQLGTGTTSPSGVPVRVAAPGGVTFTRIAAGEAFSLARAADGTVWSWGRGADGVLGQGTTSDVLVPSPTDPGSAMGSVTDVVAGDAHALALDAAGSLWAWGQQSGGPMGTDPAFVASTVPIPVSMTDFAPGTAVALATGREHTLATDETGLVWAWGNNLHSELGEFAGNVGALEVPVSATDDVLGMGPELAVGDDASYVLVNGGVESWGGDDLGQLGRNDQDATATANAAPVEIDGTKTLVEVAAGADFALARSDDGTVYAWGGHGDGQLGVGSLPSAATSAPIPVALDRSAPVLWSPLSTR